MIASSGVAVYDFRLKKPTVCTLFGYGFCVLHAIFELNVSKYVRVQQVTFNVLTVFSLCNCGLFTEQILFCAVPRLHYTLYIHSIRSLPSKRFSSRI